MNRRINVIIIDPANTDVLYLASNFGFFRSLDGGLNWTAGLNAAGDVRSLILDASTSTGSRILYAGISGRGVLRSNDGGVNWTEILNRTTPVIAAAVGSTTANFNKVVVDIAPPTSPPNPLGVQVLYVSLQGTGGAPDPVVFMSTDQGATWTQRTASGMPTRTQGGYSFHMALDPGSPGDGVNDIIYFGCVNQAISLDSGNNFTSIGTGGSLPTNATDLHPDTWAFVRQLSSAPSIVFCGTDGGLNKSTNRGTTWTPLNSGGLQTGLFYNIDMKPDSNGSVTLGALQDNMVDTTAAASGLGWRGTHGGDGWDVAYDGTVAGRVYCTDGFWSPAPCTRAWRSTDDGSTFPTEITPWGTTSDSGCYLASIATDPSNGGILYISGNQNLCQSRDAGNTWRTISPFANTGDVDVARINGNNVVIAVDRQVFVSTNALAATVGPPSGVIFTNITRNLPNKNVTRVIFDPNDPDTIFAVLGGFNSLGNVGHVFRTSIGAYTWTDISPVSLGEDLEVPFTAIALDGSETPSAIYVGTYLGVLRSIDGGSSWSVLDDIHFPRVPVWDLVLRNGILRAGTYGRGAFAFVKPTGPAIAVDLEHNHVFDAGRGPQYLTLEIFNVGVQDLIISSVQRLMGSTSFTVLFTPGTPLSVAPGGHIEFTVVYNFPGGFGSGSRRDRNHSYH